MVVIALIWIIALATTRINFTKLSNKERLNGFFYKIKNNFETTTNNALIWKAIKDWWNIIVPKQWRIELNNSDKWSIKTYFIDDTWNPIEYTMQNIIPDDNYSISIACKKINTTSTWTLLNTWVIIIESWTLNLSSWCDSDKKELQITAKYKNNEKIFTINTISWVIEEK